MLYANHYDCSRCGLNWTDDWSCMCDDRCPECRLACSPTSSEVVAVDLDGAEAQDD